MGLAGLAVELAWRGDEEVAGGAAREACRRVRVGRGMPGLDRVGRERTEMI
mgnify:FL=1